MVFLASASQILYLDDVIFDIVVPLVCLITYAGLGQIL